MYELVILSRRRYLKDPNYLQACLSISRIRSSRSAHFNFNLDSQQRLSNKTRCPEYTAKTKHCFLVIPQNDKMHFKPVVHNTGSGFSVNFIIRNLGTQHAGPLPSVSVIVGPRYLLNALLTQQATLAGCALIDYF
jgi:hypothetical protein